MNLLNPKYNILKIAGSTLGHKHSQETLTKLKNYKPSTEALVKLRLAKELTGNIVIIINKNNNFVIRGDCIKLINPLYKKINFYKNNN